MENLIRLCHHAGFIIITCNFLWCQTSDFCVLCKSTMLFLFQMFLVHLLACDPLKNDPVTNINPGCNNAGLCVFVGFDVCFCCTPEICGEHWTCDPEDPLQGCVQFSGNTCTTVKQYFYANFGFRAEDRDPNAPSDIFCNTIPHNRALYNQYLNPSFDFGLQVQNIVTEFGWPGISVSVPFCDTCSPAYPCIKGVDEKVNATAGSTYGFQIDFQEYYNLSCGTGAILYNKDMQKECVANYDYGQLGYKEWLKVRGNIEEGDNAFIYALNDLLEASPNAGNECLGLS